MTARASRPVPVTLVLVDTATGQELVLRPEELHMTVDYHYDNFAFQGRDQPPILKGQTITLELNFERLYRPRADAEQVGVVRYAIEAPSPDGQP